MRGVRHAQSEHASVSTTAACVIRHVVCGVAHVSCLTDRTMWRHRIVALLPRASHPSHLYVRYYSTPTAEHTSTSTRTHTTPSTSTRTHAARVRDPRQTRSTRPYTNKQTYITKRSRDKHPAMFTSTPTVKPRPLAIPVTTRITPTHVHTFVASLRAPLLATPTLMQQLTHLITHVSCACDVATYHLLIRVLARIGTPALCHVLYTHLVTHACTPDQHMMTYMCQLYAARQMSAADTWALYELMAMWVKHAQQQQHQEQHQEQEQQQPQQQLTITSHHLHMLVHRWMSERGRGYVYIHAWSRTYNHYHTHISIPFARRITHAVRWRDADGHDVGATNQTYDASDATMIRLTEQAMRAAANGTVKTTAPPPPPAEPSTASTSTSTSPPTLLDGASLPLPTFPSHIPSLDLTTLHLLIRALLISRAPLTELMPWLDLCTSYRVPLPADVYHTLILLARRTRSRAVDETLFYVRLYQIEHAATFHMEDADLYDVIVCAFAQGRKEGARAILDALHTSTRAVWRYHFRRAFWTRETWVGEEGEVWADEHKPRRKEKQGDAEQQRATSTGGDGLGAPADGTVTASDAAAVEASPLDATSTSSAVIDDDADLDDVDADVDVDADTSVVMSSPEDVKDAFLSYLREDATPVRDTNASAAEATATATPTPTATATTDTTTASSTPEAPETTDSNTESVTTDSTPAVDAASTETDTTTETSTLENTAASDTVTTSPETASTDATAVAPDTTSPSIPATLDITPSPIASPPPTLEGRITLHYVTLRAAAAAAVTSLCIASTPLTLRHAIDAVCLWNPSGMKKIMLWRDEMRRQTQSGDGAWYETVLQHVHQQAQQRDEHGAPLLSNDMIRTAIDRIRHHMSVAQLPLTPTCITHLISLYHHLSAPHDITALHVYLIHTRTLDAATLTHIITCLTQYVACHADVVEIIQQMQQHGEPDALYAEVEMTRDLCIALFYASARVSPSHAWAWFDGITHPSMDHFITILTCLAHDHTPTRHITRILSSLGAYNYVWSDAALFHRVCDVLASHGDVARIEMLLQRVTAQATPLSLDITSYHIMLRACAIAHDATRAYRIVYTIPPSTLTRDMCHLVLLTHTHDITCPFHDATRMHAFMQQHPHLAPDIVTHDIMLHVCKAHARRTSDTLMWAMSHVDDLSQHDTWQHMMEIACAGTDMDAVTSLWDAKPDDMSYQQTHYEMYMMFHVRTAHDNMYTHLVRLYTTMRRTGAIPSHTLHTALQRCMYTSTHDGYDAQRVAHETLQQMLQKDRQSVVREDVVVATRDEMWDAAVQPIMAASIPAPPPPSLDRSHLLPIVTSPIYTAALHAHWSSGSLPNDTTCIKHVDILIMHGYMYVACDWIHLMMTWSLQVPFFLFDRLITRITTQPLIEEMIGTPLASQPFTHAMPPGVHASRYHPSTLYALATSHGHCADLHPPLAQSLSRDYSINFSEYSLMLTVASIPVIMVRLAQYQQRYGQ